MTRLFLGDSNTLSIPLAWNNLPFEPGSGWNLIFTVKSSLSDPDSAARIQKQSGAGITVAGSTASVVLLPADTASLAPRTYYADIQAESLSTGEVRTVAFLEFELARDVTRGTTTSIPVITTEPPAPIGPPGPAGPAATVTAAAIAAALPSATAAEEDAIIRDIAARSAAIGIYDDFSDRTTYADGAAITHLSTLPRVGSVYRLSVPATAPTVVHASGGLVPANGAGLFYLGSSARSRNGSLFLAFELTPIATASPSGTQDLGLNISFSNAEMITAGGGISPTGVVHINFDASGVKSADFFPSTALACRNASYDGTRYPWNSQGTSWATGKKQLIILEVLGDFLRITAPGHGSLEFYHADISTKIGANSTNWWLEPSGSDAPGSQQFRRKVVLHRVTDSQERVQNESWGGDALAAISTQGQANIPTRVRLVGDPAATYKTGGTPTASDDFYLATPKRVGAHEGTWSYPWPSRSWYPSPCYANGISTEQSCPTGTDQTWSAGLFGDFELSVGQSYEITMRGVTAANGNTKRIKLRNFAFSDVGLGAGIVFDSGDFTDNAKPWKLVMRKRRITSHAHVFFFEWSIGSSAPVLANVLQTGSAGAYLPLTNLSTAGAAGDLKAYDMAYRMEPY
jgi:hypothetical protein